MKFAIIPPSWTPSLLSLLRVMTGLLLLEHGTGKFFAFPSLPGLDQIPSGLLYASGGLELVGGALLVIGFLTRPVAFILSGFMAVAYFMAHAPGGFFPVLNHGELAILFCFVCLTLAAAGPGRWSVDEAVGVAA
jgi:putative oxidoreductase